MRKRAKKPRQVRIDGPDSTRQYRIVDARTGDVLMDGYRDRILAAHAAGRAGYAIVAKNAACRPAPKRRAKAKKRANPDLLTLTNPSDAKLRKAIAAFRRFHGCEPKVIEGDGDAVLIDLGEIRRVDYEPARGDRKRVTWFHHFKRGARLATDPDGRRLVVVDIKGKRLVDFDRGIVR